MPLLDLKRSRQGALAVRTVRAPRGRPSLLIGRPHSVLQRGAERDGNHSAWSQSIYEVANCVY
jgi:hypothetical protein